MPVPTSIADLSQTEASNSPAGSDAIGSGLDNYLRATQAILKESGAALYTATGTDTITVTTNPTFASYFTGLRLWLVSAGANATTSVTLNVNGLGAKSITKNGATALAIGDIPASAVFCVVYDGTRFQLVSSRALNEATSGPGGSAFSFRNKLINGSFGINQRVYVSGATVGTGLYGHDRWKMAASGDTYTFSTTNNKTTVTIPAGKVLQQVVEGLNLQTGTYVLSWEGTAQGKIGAGSYGASGVTGSITGGTNTTIEFGPGTVTNVQLEIGSVATPFEHRPVGTELALCQRYYYRITDQSDYATLTCGSTTVAQGAIHFPVQMRIAPTALEQSGTAADYALWGGTTVACSSVPIHNNASKTAAVVRATVASGLTAGNARDFIANSASAYLGWSAEL